MCQSRMDNPEKLVQFDAQYTERRQTKQKQQTQETKKMSNTDSTKNRR